MIKALTPSNVYDHLPQNSHACMAQIGWLGFSGKVYGKDTSLDVIHQYEKGGYEPLYIQIGEWKLDQDGDWYLEQD